MRGQDREPAKRDRPSVRPASIEDADGCAQRENTWSEDRRPQSVQPFGSQGSGRSSKTQFTLSGPPRRRVITGNGDRRSQQYRQICRCNRRKINGEAADVLDMWMQPRPPHPCNRRPCKSWSRCQHGWTCRPPTPTAAPPARAMDRSSKCELQRRSIGYPCEHDRSQQQSGGRARFRSDAIWPAAAGGYPPTSGRRGRAADRPRRQGKHSAAAHRHRRREWPSLPFRTTGTACGSNLAQPSILPTERSSVSCGPRTQAISVEICPGRSRSLDAAARQE